MLSPKQLNEFLEKTVKNFELKNIFISNELGNLIACYPQNDNQYFTQLMYDILTNYQEVLKKVYKDGKIKYLTLKHDNGVVYMTYLQNKILLGMETYQNENTGMFIKKSQMIHQYLQEEFKDICS